MCKIKDTLLEKDLEENIYDRFDEKVCDVCQGTKKVAVNEDGLKLVPCPECQKGYYAEYDDSEQLDPER